MKQCSKLSQAMVLQWRVIFYYTAASRIRARPRSSRFSGKWTLYIILGVLFGVYCDIQQQLCLKMLSRKEQRKGRWAMCQQRTPNQKNSQRELKLTSITLKKQRRDEKQYVGKRDKNRRNNIIGEQGTRHCWRYVITSDGLNSLCPATRCGGK